MRVRLLLGACLVAACSTGSPEPTTAPAPSRPAPSGGGAAPKPATPSGIEVARLAPGDLRFQVTRHDSLTLLYPTGSQSQVLDRTAWLRVLLTSDNAVTIVLDSLRSTGGLSPDSLRALDGLLWNGAIERGRLGALRPSRTSSLAEQLALPLAQELVPALPVTGVKAGATWRDSTTRAQHVVGAELPMTAVTEFTVRDAASRKELELVGAARLAAKGTSAQFGQPIDITASGTRQRTWRLSSTGQLSGVEGSDSLAMALDVPSVGQTVPATQVGRLTATRVPPH